MMRSNWQDEVQNFRVWAVSYDQQEEEWETAYGEEKWEEIYQSVGEFLATSPSLKWTAEEVKDLLYLLARDYVWAEVAAHLRRDLDGALHLASKSLSFPDVEPVSRWELARILGYLPSKARIEPLLLRFADDEAEYVRRMALQSLARISSLHTEDIALREWNREDENQQWSRMNALACWHHIASPLLEMHLVEAEASPLPSLSDFARRLRCGEVAFS